jgi:hypothetical protein
MAFGSWASYFVGVWGVEMSAIQLVAAAFAVAMMYQAYLNFRRDDLSLAGFGFWSLLWVGLLAVSLLPGFFQNFITVAHVARLLDLVTILGLLALTGISYRLYVTVRGLQKTIATLVRQIALEDFAASADSATDQA